MNVELLADEDAVAKRAAAFLAAAAREAVAARGKFVVAVSGGKTPWQMLRELANETVPWSQVQIVQVDERVAPDGDPSRNLTHLKESLLSHAPLKPEQIHAMPVGDADLEAAAARYAATLATVAGAPPVIDLVHLGLGPDGHTASLTPGDAVLEVRDRDVAPTAGLYQGQRRLTLTYPILDRARQVMWVVTGASKRTAMAQLLKSDPAIPAGRVRPQAATLFADRAAAG